MTPRILIVEDEAITALDLKGQLREMGYVVTGTAASSEDAIAAAARSSPDLILMDIMIQGSVDGIETAAMLRETCRAGIVYLSALSDEDILRRATATGAHGYLVKPVRPVDLRATIEMALAKRALEQRLRESEERVRLIADNVGGMIAYIDHERRLRFVNRRVSDALGFDAGRLVGRRLTDILRADLYERLHPHLDHAYAGRTGSFEGEVDGRVGLVHYVPEGEGGTVRGVYVLISDITARVRAERALRDEKERFQATLHSIGDAVLSVDARGRVETLNPVAETLTGWDERSAVGKDAALVLRLADESSGEALEPPIRAAISEGAASRLSERTVLISRTGQHHAIEDSCTPIMDASGQVGGAVLVFRDVTERRRMVERLAYQARHDPLTGLLNRREFELALKARWDDARSFGHRHALLYIDLDQFKLVNEACGHHAGDQLLQQLSALMGDRMRGNVLARLGGDVFGAVVDEAPLHRAQQLAEQLIHAIGDHRFHWDQRVFRVGASVGVVAIDDQVDDCASLLIAADMACQLAKDKGRYRVQVFRSDDVELLRQRGKDYWIARIPDALENDRFRLFAQRIAPLDRARASGPKSFEILLRLEERAGIVTPPMAFLPAAESYNMMQKIDRWVIDRLIRDVAPGQGGASAAGAGTKYSINLSGASLADPDLVEFVVERLHRTSLDPSQLTFEITETAAVSNLDRAISVVRRLRGLGCKMALDDFGTGLSSFAYLRAFPVDFLKIDGSFVKDLTTAPLHSALVEGVNRIGHELGIQTVAEHVENEAVLERLRQIGVDYGQGYAIHEPQPLQQILEGRMRQTEVV